MLYFFYFTSVVRVIIAPLFFAVCLTAGPKYIALQGFPAG